MDFLDFWERKKQNPREWVKSLGDKESVYNVKFISRYFM